MTEVEHEIGRVGAFRVKRALEQTTRFNIEYTAYDPVSCTEVLLLTDDKKRFDLSGNHLKPDLDTRCPIFVEAKNEKAGGQKTAFLEFLAVSYSATKRWQDDHGSDPAFEFMFAMICPWRGGSEFYDCASATNIRQAVESEASPESKIIPENHEVDEQLIAALADRIWVWVIPRRQEEMSIGKTVMGWIQEKRALAQEEFAA